MRAIETNLVRVNGDGRDGVEICCKYIINDTNLRMSDIIDIIGRENIIADIDEAIYNNNIKCDEHIDIDKIDVYYLQRDNTTIVECFYTQYYDFYYGDENK